MDKRTHLIIPRFAMPKFLLFLCASFFLLCGCSADDANTPANADKALEHAEEMAPKSETGQETSSGPAGNTRPEKLPTLTEAERKRADRILAFSNNAHAVFHKTYLSLPETLRQNSRRYLETFRLAPCPRVTGRKWALDQLGTPTGLFTDEDANKLGQGLRNMDKALTAMLAHYRELENYVADDTVRDDGKKGEELSKKIDRDYARFTGARKDWLDTVESNAAQAEKQLLRGHPLERQILAAHGIFAQFGKIAELLKTDKPDRTMLLSLGRNLEAIIAEAGKPPFDAAPSLERLYRAFLANARSYAKALDRGIQEGFFPTQKREINQAVQSCGAAYNKFAQTANKMSRN